MDKTLHKSKGTNITREFEWISRVDHGQMVVNFYCEVRVKHEYVPFISEKTAVIEHVKLIALSFWKALEILIQFHVEEKFRKKIMFVNLNKKK